MRDYIFEISIEEVPEHTAKYLYFNTRLNPSWSVKYKIKFIKVDCSGFYQGLMHCLGHLGEMKIIKTP